jgi:hypothetical protein
MKINQKIRITKELKRKKIKKNNKIIKKIIEIQIKRKTKINKEMKRRKIKKNN